MITNIFKIWGWTLFNPVKVNRLIRSTNSTRLVRRALLLLGALCGVLIAVVYRGDLSLILVLAALGILTSAVASLNLKESHTDALGLMFLGVLSMFFMVSSNFKKSDTENLGWVTSLAFFVGFVAAMYLGWRISRKGINRSFLFWPLGLLSFLLFGVQKTEPWVFNILGKLVTSLPTISSSALLLLLLIICKMYSAEICIQSHTHVANTENYYARTLVSFKRDMALTYLVFALLCGPASLLYPELPKLRYMMISFLLGCAWELEPIQFLVLWLRLKQKNAEAIAGNPVALTDKNQNPLFLIPTLPFAPPGINQFLVSLETVAGERAAAFFAAELLLETGYHRATTDWLTRLAGHNPQLYNLIAERVNQAVPTEVREEPGPEPRQPVQSVEMPISTPTLYAVQFDDTDLEKQLYLHHYEPPRGKEGAPLAMLPIWFPVANPPLETMTLPQIIYRSLASVREPFRRTTLVLPDADDAKNTYTKLMEWAVGWAYENLGAALIPVPLSLTKLVEKSDAFEALYQDLLKNQSKTNIDGPGHGDISVFSACQKIIQWGSMAIPPNIPQLIAAIAAGNAWLLIEDDRPSKSSLKIIKKTLDLVLSHQEFSHAAVILVTDNKKYSPVLSDTQDFHLTGTHQPPKKEPEKKIPPIPGKLKTLLCRIFSYLGSPSGKVTAIACMAVALPFLIFIITHYPSVALVTSENENISEASMPMVKLLRLIGGVGISVFIIAPFVVGYIWGLAYGSEEVRRSSVDALTIPIFAAITFFLMLIPKSMSPGIVKTILVTITALPFSLLTAMVLLTLFSLWGNVMWLILSLRITRNMDKEHLVKLCDSYNVTLHTAHQAVPVQLPRQNPSPKNLPLLICFKNNRLIPIVLDAFPELTGLFRRLIVQGLRKEKTDWPHSTYASSSLLMESFLAIGSTACQRCLQMVGNDCLRAWHNQDEFDEYRRPSTSFTMNALEYTARRLCYITDIEELIVMR